MLRKILYLSLSVVLVVGLSIANSSALEGVETSDHLNYSNTSDLFAKVLELEEQIRKLNGSLQRSEHEREALSTRVEGLYNHISAREKPSSNTVPDKDQSSYLTSIAQASSLINKGENKEAIKLLDLQLQKKKSTIEEGELYYWLAKAYANEKLLDKAAHYFAKSYRYNVDVKSKNILVGLIDTLASDGKYKQICPLLSNLDTKYIISLSETKRNKINNLKKLYCP